MSRRVLIDECLPIPLHPWPDGFDARIVAFMGWAGKRDRELRLKIRPLNPGDPYFEEMGLEARERLL